MQKVEQRKNGAPGDKDEEMQLFVSSISNILQRNKIDRIRKVDDQDLDSVGEDKVITEIDNDNISIASSLTANTGNILMREEQDDDSVGTLNSQETFGQGTIKINAGTKAETTKSEAAKILGTQIFSKIIQAGKSKEEIIEKAQQYIRRKVSRDFQEPPATYQQKIQLYRPNTYNYTQIICNSLP